MYSFCIHFGLFYTIDFFCCQIRYFKNGGGRGGGGGGVVEGKKK